MKAHHILLLGGLTLLFCAPLDAQRKRKKGKGGADVTKIFERLDKNKDGKITAAEAEGSRIAKAFAKIDTDKDGAITKTELTASSSGKGRKGKGRKGKRRKGGGKGN